MRQSWLADPLFEDVICWGDSLTAVLSKEKTVTLNKPLFCGLAVLELSKLHMYRFHYDYMRAKYGDKIMQATVHRHR